MRVVLDFVADFAGGITGSEAQIAFASVKCIAHLFSGLLKIVLGLSTDPASCFYFLLVVQAYAWLA